MIKRKHIITIICAIVLIFIAYSFRLLNTDTSNGRVYKVGYVYVGDASNPYTANFLKAQEAIEETYGDKIESIALYNISEGNEEEALVKLAKEGCDIIFATSYGYGPKTKEVAKRYPTVQFCMATGDNANDGEFVENYHTYMGSIHEGRYVAGVIAGMKLKEYIDEGKIKPEEAKIGYVGAYPYAEVISGYTAFFLGIRSVVPEATMVVKYTNTWSSYAIEKRVANELIDEGCIVISQHSDTEGPAVACEQDSDNDLLIHVGYNISMIDIAPTSSLVSTKINWEPYMVAAVGAVVDGKNIEKTVEGNAVLNDVGAGLKEGWVSIVGLNKLLAAEGTEECMEKTIKEISGGNLQVFKGDYTGTNPFDPEDTIDLSEGYEECEMGSAPSFGYVLDDVITVEE